MGTVAPQKPNIGRIVHYVNLGDKDGKYPPEIQGAMITGIYVNDPNSSELLKANTVDADLGRIATAVDLRVFYRTGTFDCQKIPFSDKYERGHWSWPPRS